MMVTKERYGFVGGREILLFTLSNEHVSIAVINYGATIVSIVTKDRFDRSANIVAGFPDLSGYLGPHPYFGSVIGRFANRIKNGRFTLNEKKYQLSQNDGVNHLHGGVHGFDRKVWRVDGSASTPSHSSVSFSCLSNDGEEGYPGNLETQITYTLNAQQELSIEYRANSDQPTPLNLTSHGYFNLTGFEKDNVYDHELQLFSDWHTETDETCIPTGRLLPNTTDAFDFSNLSPIGKKIRSLSGNGYNHNFVTRYSHEPTPAVACLYEPESGRLVFVSSDQPGLQVYTANEWDGSLTGSHKKPYGRHSAIALETQHYPDSPNHPGFPDCIVDPRKPFYSKTIYRFDTR